MLHCRCPPNSLHVHQRECPYFTQPCVAQPVDQMQVVRICMSDNITCRGKFVVRQCRNCDNHYRCGDGRWVRCPTREGLLREISDLEVMSGMPHHNYSVERSEVVAKDICNLKAELKASSCAVNYCSTDCYYSSLCWYHPPPLYR